MAVSREMRLLCPAKVNLHLRVGPGGADGFHPLLSWMCTVGLFDRLTLGLSEARAAGPPKGGTAPRRETAPPCETQLLAGAVAARAPAPASDPASGIRLALECEPAGLPCDEKNLVVRVASAWRAAGTPTEPLPATLGKRIPVGAGLGGGSSDAARMILALQRLWPGGDGATVLQAATPEPSGLVSPGALSAFAARFGSDVPFFLAGPSSVCTGRGEIVRPIAAPRPSWCLLVLPELMMPTPDVYRRFDAMSLGRRQDVEQQRDWRHWEGLDSLSLLPLLVNDLEVPAFSIRPELGALRQQAEALLSRPVRMSGSGSSLFTLFDTEGDARAASDRLSKAPMSLRARFEVVRLAPAVPDDLEEPDADSAT